SPGALALANGMRHGMALAKLKVGLLVLLPLTLLLAFAGLAAFPPRKPAEKKQATALEKVVRAPVPAPRQPVARAPVVAGPIWALAFSPDSRRLVTAGGQPANLGQLKVLNVLTARELGTVDDVPAMRAVAFAPDGQALASGEFGGAIRLRDPATGQERAMWQG